MLRLTVINVLKLLDKSKFTLVESEIFAEFDLIHNQLICTGPEYKTVRFNVLNN